MKFYDQDEKKENINNIEKQSGEQKENTNTNLETEEQIQEQLKIEEKNLDNEERPQKDNNQEENNFRPKRKIIKASVISVIIFLILLIACTGFALLNINNSRIMIGVTIQGLDIKGLTAIETEKKITEKIQNNLEKDINFKADDFEYSIKLNQIEVKYNTEKAIQEAYGIGRNGNIFVNNFNILKAMIFGTDVKLDFEYNEELLNGVISDISVKVPNAVVETDYYIDESKLIITKGKPGNTIDKEKLKAEILSKINNKDNSEIKIELLYREPSQIDIDKIYKEVYTEPKNAYYTKQPFEIFPHVNGIDFDIEAAREVLKEDKEEYEIELKIQEPEITTNEIGTEAFPDLLSTFSTRYDASQTGRSKNLRLAAEKINGTVVMPGEIFSYNKTVGERTISAGYTEAAGYAGGKVVPTLGGGICQISTTLYDAVIYANLDIVERRNHMFLTSYVGAGKDATVVYGAIDFKFKNTRNYPIKIEASVKNGIAKVDIYGIKEDVEYEVEILTKILNYIPFNVKYETNNSLKVGQEKVTQSGMNGVKSITYKILKLNGQQVSSTVLSTDTYDAMNKIIQKGPAEITTSTKPERNEKENNIQTEVKPNNNSNNTNKPSVNTNTITNNNQNTNNSSNTTNQNQNTNTQNTTSTNTIQTNNTSQNQTNNVVKNEI